jgi:4'-phosphopantetheinyl transferase
MTALVWPTNWQSTLPAAPPRHADVHIWAVQPAAVATAYERFFQLLSQTERARALRFHFERDRITHVVARGALRLILGRYLQLSPTELHFDTTRFDKPFITHPQTTMQFNISHSADVVLLAFTASRDVGVDVESIRPMPDADQIVTRFFSANEIATWRGLPPSQQNSAFFTCWTRKEAFIKALGEGLSHPLDQFDVTLQPGETAQLSPNDRSQRTIEGWTIRALPMPENYAAALVVAGDHNTPHFTRIADIGDFTNR